MTKEDIISQKLVAYDDAFDFYMDRGRMPDGVPADDLLGDSCSRPLMRIHS